MALERLFDSLFIQKENFPQKAALAAKEDGVWRSYSTDEVIEIVNELSNGLLQMGIKRGDKIGLVSYNRPEWVFVDLAISQIGVINVPMYPNSTSDDYNFIIKHAEIKLIFCGDLEIYDKLKSASFDESNIYTFDASNRTNHWKSILKSADETSLKSIEELRDNINREDLATIIYTSGTTGEPKGVMLSHENITSNAQAVAQVISSIKPGMKTLSFLPLSHIFERTGLYTYMHMGIGIYYAESIETIGENLKEVQPHFFASVPRLLEKVYDKIVKKGYELTGIKKQLFFWALHLGQRFELDKNLGWWYNTQMKLASKLIFSKWREALGGNIEFVVSGGAALQPRLATIFWAAGIRILEAYGLTETSPGVSFSRDDSIKIGTVGPMLDKVQVKIAADGEVLVKGPNVMMGYYKNEEATKSVLTKDGWFHTGDIGEMVDDTFLKITDRKKEMFKTSGGKYIAPQLLENSLKESMLIEQVMVIGENKRFPGALIVPSFESLRDWCELHSIAYTTDSEILENEKVVAKFQSELDHCNRTYAQYEKVKKFKLLNEPWTVEAGELTAKLSMKRRVILKRNQQAVEEIYAHE
ncbi:MAG: long-chain fatty acid--CoA ligase [Bacteroidota bacterium]